MSNNPSLAWAAGFLDGEGCIGVYGRPGGSYGLQVTAAQVERGPLEALQSLFGGSIRTQRGDGRKRRDAWVWGVYAHVAASALALLMPYLIGKVEQARLAIQFQSLMYTSHTRRPHHLTGLDLAERLSFCEALKESKRGE